MGETLDLRGLRCPLPVLKANKALRALPPGSTLAILATDPAAVTDFHAYAGETGHELLLWAEDPVGEYRFVLRRREAP
jgi:tRNA 2-thiouridine synthesizing protein A